MPRRGKHTRAKRIRLKKLNFTKQEACSGVVEALQWLHKKEWHSSCWRTCINSYLSRKGKRSISCWISQGSRRNRSFKTTDIETWRNPPRRAQKLWQDNSWGLRRLWESFARQQGSWLWRFACVWCSTIQHPWSVRTMVQTYLGRRIVSPHTQCLVITEQCLVRIQIQFNTSSWNALRFDIVFPLWATQINLASTTNILHFKC